MAHCSPCKSKLGTGGYYPVQGDVKLVGRPRHRSGTGARSSAWTTTHVSETSLVQSNGSINRQLWVPALSSEAAVPTNLGAWAYFPGGAKARLHINGVTQTRRVLAHRNGGPTGLEVRLGPIVKAFGTGCLGDRLRQVRAEAEGVGTGGPRRVSMRSITASMHTGASSSWYRATFFDKQPSGNPRSWVKIIKPPQSSWDPSGQGIWYRNFGQSAFYVGVPAMKGKNGTLKVKITGGLPVQKDHQGIVDVQSVQYGPSGTGGVTDDSRGFPILGDAIAPLGVTR